ncbi:hypothetical protein Tco_0690002 [Tanacetum coccineum]
MLRNHTHPEGGAEICGGSRCSDRDVERGAAAWDHRGSGAVVVKRWLVGRRWWVEVGATVEVAMVELIRGGSGVKTR